ncbi:MAG: ABC transporter substrate-binding protein [Methanobacteriota archaeon]
MRAARVVLALALTLVLVLSGTAALAAPISRRPARTFDGALTIGHLFAIDSLNPFIGFSNEAYLFYSLVYDYLFSLDQDQNYVPNLALGSESRRGLACSGTANPDAYCWVYQIRQGVRWHDGTPLTAEDVNFTINYNIQAFWLLWAYQPYVNQVLQCEPGQTSGCGARVTGTSEVTIFFRGPFSPGYAAIVLPIIQKRQWENITATSAQYSFLNPNPIGSGPYMADPNIYDQWFNNRPIVLHRNPNYHFGAPAVERVVFRLFSDEAAMILALQNGEIDVVTMSSAGYETLRGLALPGIELQEGITVIQYWIDIGITQLNHFGVNQDLNPSRFDLDVRQAMAHATDKDYVLSQFYRGKGVAGSTLVSPVTPFWHYEPGPEKFDFNLTKANAILDAAGYTVRDPGTGLRRAAADKTLSLYCSAENLAKGCQTSITIPQGTPLRFTMVTRVEAPEEGDIATYLDQVWNSIGIDLLITPEQEIAMNTDVYGGGFDTYIWWWSADSDPNYILSIQSNYTLSGWSDNFYDNETYNSLYLAQLAAFDVNERQQAVHEMQKVHYLGAAFIILVYPFFHYAWWIDEFRGWGDMNLHPGRQLGAFWGKHPLFLELQPNESTGGFLPTGTVVLIAVGVAAAVAVIVGVVLVLSARKKKAEESLPEIPPMPPPP